MWPGMLSKLLDHGISLIQINRVEQVATEDAHLLQLLSNAGAVFHVRTNQPQALMVSTSPNP